MGAAAPLVAQQTAPLDRVEELASQGRTEEARAMLLTWFKGSAGSATRREIQRGLWLRGRLTVDPAQAALDFRRLVIEYPGGPYSDLALFRLAQSAYASGDSLAAVGQVDRLAREYPTSAVRREAEAWLATAGPVPPRAVAAQAEGTVAVRGDSLADKATVEPVTSQAPTALPEASRGQFTVQLGAFSSEGRAEALRRRAADAGFEARLVTVPGSALIRVRVGVFDAQEGADDILKRLRELGFTAALARDAHREERVRR
ncbi:MAG TPA: SPOR domain-containing protein [Longimicrobiales bacterium]|nr:SPOR domain-containing protein [Longimicrobiales bacterium]